MAKACLRSVLKVLWAAYFLLTSLYCLLAYLPYTYYSVVKEPPYGWVVWFVQRQAGLAWLALVAAGVAYWPWKSRAAYRIAMLGAAAWALLVSIHPFLASLRNDGTALAWSFASLSVVLSFALTDLFLLVPGKASPEKAGLLPYWPAFAAAAAIALASAGGAYLRTYVESHVFRFNGADAELLAWSAVAHICVAALALSLLNLCGVITLKARYPRAVRTGLLLSLAATFLWIAVVRFLGHSLSFEGGAARLYAAVLAASLTATGFSAGRSFFHHRKPGPLAGKVVAIALAFALLAVIVVLPTAIGGSDWNNFVQATFALICWAALGISAYSLWTRRVSYSLTGVMAVAVFSLITYQAMKSSALLWGRPLGGTDDEISRAFDNYAEQDVSFQLAHILLGDGKDQPCGDLCRILREYTNVRDTRARSEVSLVDPLTPATGDRPHIFIFVIDSLRQDYVGAYNPKVDFTPHLDTLARESFVFRNAYSQYAGTSLSEPAIWAGAELLHAHYLQPFAKVNGLEKLARLDGYQMIVSVDPILAQLLSPSDNLVRLDTDKTLWNHFEACSTIRQAEQALDRRGNPSPPVLFYAQPENVHQFAHNDMRTATEDHWRSHPGFNDRMAHAMNQVDGCLGGFFEFLKQRGMYDHSIVVLTADHGDATGEFGRRSHSTILYPEVLRVPLIVHVPPSMRQQLVASGTPIAAPVDVTPTLYLLLGHHPIERNPLFGRPLLGKSQQALQSYYRHELFIASDVRAAYGILDQGGRYLYAVYDSPAKSELYDLERDPNALSNLSSESVANAYDARIIEHLRALGDFYGYRPGLGLLLASARH